jgi:hypothetical protein
LMLKKFVKMNLQMPHFGRVWLLTLSDVMQVIQLPGKPDKQEILTFTLPDKFMRDCQIINISICIYFLYVNYPSMFNT